MDDDLFEAIRPLPDEGLHARSQALVGFDARYARVARNLRLIIDRARLDRWSKRHHSRVLPVCARLAERHALVVFAGDVGTGKTVSAEGIADRLTRELDRPGFLLKLSTRVRGRGLHGEMTRLIQAGFERVIKEAGKKRLAFLLIDEADALAATRTGGQMHQEEKAAVNTLIQRLDDLRQAEGRAIVILCTNRPGALDPAILRRASVREDFDRPNDAERAALLGADLEGVGLSRAQIARLVRATGPQAHDGLGMTWSDMRLRWLPEAVARVFPDAPLDLGVLEQAARDVQPSPRLEEG